MRVTFRTLYWYRVPTAAARNVSPAERFGEVHEVLTVIDLPADNPSDPETRALLAPKDVATVTVAVVPLLMVHDVPDRDTLQDPMI